MKVTHTQNHDYEIDPVLASQIILADIVYNVFIVSLRYTFPTPGAPYQRVLARPMRPLVDVVVLMYVRTWLRVKSIATSVRFTGEHLVKRTLMSHMILVNLRFINGLPGYTT